MTDQRNTGGQAFPCEGGFDSGLHADPGMTLRDYFAAKALQGFLANPQDFREEGFLLNVVESAYKTADAMLETRNK